MNIRPIHYLVFGFASVLALLVILLHISLSRLDGLSSSLTQITHEQFEKNRLINIMHEGIRKRQISLRNVLLKPNFFEREEESLLFHSYATPIAESRNKLYTLKLSAEEKSLVDHISALMKIAYPIQNDLVDAAVWGEKIEGLDSRLTAAIASQNTVIDELKKLSEFHEKQTNSTILESELMIQGARNLVLAVGLLALVIGGTIAFIVIRIVRHQEIVIDETLDELHDANDQLETTNERLELEVEQRTHDLSIARDQALNLNRTKSQFVANMSHELRTPLNAIIGYTEMLREELVELKLPNLTNDLDNVHTAAQQLLGLIDQVLDLSKIESGNFDISAAKLDLPPFLDNIYRIALPSISNNGNRLSTNYSEEIGEINVDPMRLRQILLNLLSNAGKFTTNGEISLKVSRQTRRGNDWIKFKISDTGIGIDPALFGKIFQVFTQADNSTTRNYGGTGLGLAICQQLCLQMGGYISVDSSPGKGATFTVALPVNYSESKISIAS